MSRDSVTTIPARSDQVRMAIGIIGIGTSGPLIAMSTMPIWVLVFWRNIGGSILTAPFAIKHHRDRTGIRWAVVAGVLLAMHFGAFFLAMRYTSVASGTAIVALQPIFAAIFVKISGQHIPSKAWLGMGVAFTGVLLISGIDLHISVRAFIGDIAALVAAALGAGYLMVGSKAQKTLETTTYTTVCYFICALCSLPIALLSGNQIFHFSGREWWILIGLIAGAQFLGHTMFNIVLKRVSPAIVSLLVFFEVPVSALLAIWWLGQKPPIGIIPGIVLILLGCALFILRGRESK
jgi:drug/metabolite transporter (DMT)-like permease